MQIELKKLEKYIDIYDIFRVLMSQDNFKENDIIGMRKTLANIIGTFKGRVE